ncbi:MAG TPA: hypothetical protein K8V21_07665 [Weissella thailandensis]|uniref:hypothetical protein n=1 Tax=Weissella thailandensis TaxID=89061 RepID=UPI001DCEA602|nr:hypothetical protein [Weissella thailandensis]HJG85242.1 hypothetical protein [Weissella thailandensis]
MKPMSFLASCGSKKYLSEQLLETDLDNEWPFVWPIYQGVATDEEVNTATLKKLQFLNGLADRKQESLANAIAIAVANVMSPKE